MSSDSGSDSSCEDRPAHTLRHRRSVNYGKIVEDMSNTMEFSGLEIYNWEDDDLALRYAAARARLPYDRLSADELNYFADVTKSKPSKNLYLYLRNKCLQFWQMGPQVQLTLEAFKDQIKSPFNSDPLLIQRVHAFLERFCYINYGVFHITNYKNLSSKRKVIIIGAGFSGLAAALQLKYFGYEVVVLEGRPRFGGRAMTYRFRPETEKIDADLGAMIVMGVVGNPIMTLIDQNPIRIAQVNGTNCPIYETKGQKLATEKDRRITSAWNTLLDTCCYISKEMKINKLNNRPLSLGETMDLVCNQMELRAQRRRLNYWTHLHDLTERQQRFLQQCYILGEVIDDLTQKIEQAIKNREEYLFDIEIYKIQTKEELSRFLELRCYRRDLKMAIDKFKSLTAEIESQRAHYKELLRVEPCQVYMNSHDKQIVDFHKANLEYANGAPLHKISLEYWDADDEWEFDGSHFMIKGGYSKLVIAYTEKLQDVLKKMHVVSKVEYNDNGVQVSGVYEDSTGRKPFVEKGDICICTVPLGVLKWSILKTEDPSTKIKFDPPLPKWKISAIERMGFGSLNKLVLLFDKIFWDPNEEIFARMSETTEARGECFQFFAVPKAPVLIALIAGAAANIPDGQIAENLLVNRTMLFLRQTFPGCPPQPVDHLLTKWHKDRFSRGCYSYISVDSSDKDHEELAEPIVDSNGKPRLLFAGEHTICRWPSTVHGAILSGMREATRVVDTFQGTLPIYATREEIEAAKAAATAPYGVIPKKDLEEDDDEDIEEIEVKVSGNKQNGNQNGQSVSH